MRSQAPRLCYASDTHQLMVCDSEFSFIDHHENKHMTYNSNTNTFDFITLTIDTNIASEPKLKLPHSQCIESLVHCPGSQYVVAIMRKHDGPRYLYYVLLDKVNLKWDMNTHQKLVATDPAMISNDEDRSDTSDWSTSESFSDWTGDSADNDTGSTSPIHPDLLTELYGKRMKLSFAMISEDSGSSKHQYLVLTLSAALGHGMKQCVVHVVVGF